MSEIPYMMVNTRAEFERVRNLAWPTTDRPHLADATDPRFTDDQRATLARFESAPTPPEIVEARVVETVALAILRADYPDAKAVDDEIPEWQRLYRDRAYAAVAGYRAAQDGGEGYHVELGGQRFTQAQWEAMVVWRNGTDSLTSPDDAATWSPPAQDGGAEEAVRRVEALAAEYECTPPGTVTRDRDVALDLRAALAPQAGEAGQ